jgi:hypothetical protein
MEIERKNSESIAMKKHAILDKTTLLEKGTKIPNPE